MILHRVPEVPVPLQVHPKLGAGLERVAEDERGFGRDAAHGFAHLSVELLQEMKGEQRDVAGPVPNRLGEDQVHQLTDRALFNFFFDLG